MHEGRSYQLRWLSSRSTTFAGHVCRFWQYFLRQYRPMRLSHAKLIEIQSKRPLPVLLLRLNNRKMCFYQVVGLATFTSSKNKDRVVIILLLSSMKPFHKSVYHQRVSACSPDDDLACVCHATNRHRSKRMCVSSLLCDGCSSLWLTRNAAASQRRFVTVDDTFKITFGCWQRRDPHLVSWTSVFFVESIISS